MIGDAILSSRIGVIRAGQNGIEMCADFRQRSGKRRLHCRKIAPAIIAASHAGLIRNQDDRYSQSIAARNRLCSTRNHPQVARLRQIFDLLDDHTVPIQKNGRAADTFSAGDLAPKSRPINDRHRIRNPLAEGAALLDESIVHSRQGVAKFRVRQRSDQTFKPRRRADQKPRFVGAKQRRIAHPAQRMPGNVVHDGENIGKMHGTAGTDIHCSRDDRLRDNREYASMTRPMSEKSRNKSKFPRRISLRCSA